MNGTIKVDYLARVEGEASLFVKVKDGRVQDVRLKIFEPPRLFESFLRGRHFSEAPDITARICGICPVAYQMTAVHALERAFGIPIHPMVRELRRLLYCGEWIESHTLHIFLLHAPDFLGYADGIEMAAHHKEQVEDALRLKKIGNRILTLLGGREIHPVSVTVGGFYRVPSRSELAELAEELKWAEDAAARAIAFAGALPFPDFEQDYEFVALSHPDEYPFNEGRLVSSRGLDIDVAEYDTHFAEHQVRHSNALHSSIRGRGAYQVGPLARIHLNWDRLPATVRQACQQAGFSVPCRNPFRSIIARAAEVMFAVVEARRILDAYQPPPEPRALFETRAGTGCAITEAPRGILYNHYEVDSEGRLTSVRIVPPTSQNQRRIEEDLAAIVPTLLHLPKDEMTWRCEQAVRNYDPCISCATHFLKVQVES